MNLKHLGDALDHWKGSVLKLVGNKKLRVVPMFTDPDRWTKRNLDTYAKLLRRQREDILKQDVPFSKESRGAYFGNLGKYDLFLDPDTGIASDGKAKSEHVTPSEIASLFRESGSRMVLIYQHDSHKKDWFREKLEFLRSSESLTGCSMFAYDSGAVSMVVISRSQKRIAVAARRFRSLLGPVASARIIQ